MKTIGPYKVLGMLTGGTHPLYKVEGPGGQVLVLKTLVMATMSEDDRTRFEREAQVGRQLVHRNLLPVLDFGEADGVMYMATELLTGSDLATILAQKKSMTWEEKIPIMQQICDGMEYAHARDLVHRDLKPANVFVEQSGRVRILDFGLVRVESSNLTTAGMAVGTIAYMAPEQVRGTPCTAASDVFALGVVCYEVASGSHPFTQGKKDLSGLLTDILFTNAAPVRTLAPDVPEWFEGLLTKVMAKNPADRPKDAGAVRALMAAGPTAPPSPAPSVAATPAATKQSVITKPSAAAPVTPKPDLDGTIVMTRSKAIAARPVETKPAIPVIPRLATPPKKGLGSKFAVKVYCLSCTFGNPLGVVQCQQCGHPLEAETIAVAAQEAHQRAKFWWIAAAAVVGVAVILGLMMVFLADKL